MGIRNYADFIRVPVLLGKRQWLIELSLTTACRGMKYAMLLGRQAMANRLIVNLGKITSCLTLIFWLNHRTDFAGSNGER